MSKKSKDRFDLIEDITVEELHKDGLVEDVEVSHEEPFSKKKPDAVVAAKEIEVKASVDSSKAAQDATKPAPHNQTKGEPTAPAEPEELKRAEDAIAAGIAKVAQAPLNKVHGKPTDVAIPSVSESNAPKTKAGLINAVYQQMSEMTTEELANVYQTLTNPSDIEQAPYNQPNPEDSIAPKLSVQTPGQVAEESEEEAKKDEDESEEEESKKKEADEKKADDEESDEEEESKKKENDEEDSEEEGKKMDESIGNLLNSDSNLSEEFKSKASSLFESTVNAKVAAKVLQLEESYKTQLNEELVKATQGLAEKVDSYLSYVVSTWMEENKVAIESGLRTEIAENFIASLKNVFKESYIEVPEAKENLVDSLNKEVSKLEEQLLKTTESNMKLNETVNTLKRTQILSEASADLASTEVVKLKTLAESIDFEDENSFAKKVKSIKESYFRKVINSPKENEVEVVLNESGQEVELNPVMEAYSTAISRTIKQP